MLKNLKKKLKDQRGLTLIELLAVIVILGIIAAIAVPSIGGLIDNTKKDAHVANAQQMINSAKLAATTDTNLQEGGKYLTIEYLVVNNFIEDFESPDKELYVQGTIATTAPASGVSYVHLVDGKVTGVKLVTSKRGIQTTGGKEVVPSKVTRGAVITP